MNFSRCGVFLLSMAIVAPCKPAILVHLRNGSAIEAQSQEPSGDAVSLRVNSGTIEIARTEIQSVEAVPDPLPAPANKPTDTLTVAEMLKMASESQGLPIAFVKTVATMESALNPAAVSPKGAVGLMQLMPATANQLGVRPEAPAQNALGGAKYLRALLIRYKGDAALALAAYNAGPAAVDRYHGIPPYPETIAYVNKILKQYARLQKSSARTTN